MSYFHKNANSLTTKFSNFLNSSLYREKNNFRSYFYEISRTFLFVAPLPKTFCFLCGLTSGSRCVLSVWRHCTGGGKSANLCFNSVQLTYTDKLLGFSWKAPRHLVSKLSSFQLVQQEGFGRILGHV